MSLSLLRNLTLGLLFSVFFLSACQTNAKDVFKNVDRVVAVGDVHGDFDQYIKVLQMNKLLDDQLSWAGGETHLVQVGDLTDRGPDSLRIIRHLMSLERQAKKAGGRVHVLIGNHEAMNIQRDLRYVHPGEYSALVTDNSSALQAQYIEAVYQSRVAHDPSVAEMRETVINELRSLIPLGYVEHRTLWEPGQELGKWSANHNAVIRIDDTLFVHGGLNPHQDFQKLSKINRRIKRELSIRSDETGLSNSDDGPLWYRGLAENPEDIELQALSEMLDYYRAKRVVVGHTPTYGQVLTRLDNKVIQIDVGLSAHYGSGMANLVIENGVLMVLHRGKLISLPDSNSSLAEYYSELIELEPENSRLVRYIRSLESEPAPSEMKLIPGEGVN